MLPFVFPHPGAIPHQRTNELHVASQPLLLLPWQQANEWFRKLAVFKCGMAALVQLFWLLDSLDKEQVRSGRRLGFGRAGPLLTGPPCSRSNYACGQARECKCT